MTVWILLAHLNTGMAVYTDEYRGLFKSEDDCRGAIASWHFSYPAQNVLFCKKESLLRTSDE